MNLDFFELPVEEQINSLTTCVHTLLSQYALARCEVKSINFEFNATFSVVTEAGEKFALRININSTRTYENMLAEVEWVRFLGRVSGVNLPRPIANNSDNYISTVFHAESDQELRAVLYTWLEGEELGDEATPSQIFKVGALMAGLHQSSKDFKLTEPAKLPVFDHWLWGTEDFLLSAKSIVPSYERKLIQEAVSFIELHTAALFAETQVQIIHGDLHGWNLMWHEDVVSVFDFDDCGFGIPQQDLAVAMYYLDTPEQEEALIQGYTSVGPLPKYTGQQMAALLIQRRLVLLNYLYETKNPEHKEMLPAYLEKTIERIGTFLTDVRG